MTLNSSLDWMHVSTGRKFYPGFPHPSSIHISDIANSLALICRYGGHVDIDKFYSVAEHSVIMAEYALEDAGSFAAMYVLLHDASEAYLGDLVPAVKNLMGDTYRNLERRLMAAIMNKYSKFHDFKDYAKILDMRMIPVEKKELMRHQQPWPSDGIDPLPVRLRHWAPPEAKSRFLALWSSLCELNGLTLETLEEV